MHAIIEVLLDAMPVFVYFVRKGVSRFLWQPIRSAGKSRATCGKTARCCCSFYLAWF